MIVLREMLKALGAAHAKGIVHCDLKPENAFLIDKAIGPGTIKLLDFGIARMVVGEAPRDPDSTLRAYGTAEYMSPEQITGGTIDPRTDLYGVGAVLYEALSGTAVFAPKKGVRSTVFMRILREVPPHVVGLREPVPEPLVELVDQLLAKSPGARPASALDALRLVDEMNIVQPNSMPSIRVAVKP